MELYFVKSINPTDPPDGGVSGLWWKYEIECSTADNHNISGVREGKKDDVEKYLDKMLDSINKRTLGYQSKELRVSSKSSRSIPVNTRTSSYRTSFGGGSR